MDGPLSGIRVVEVAHYVAVPAAGALLADLGADLGARRAASLLHADAREILREAGLAEEDIEKLV